MLSRVSRALAQISCFTFIRCRIVVSCSGRPDWRPELLQGSFLPAYT